MTGDLFKDFSNYCLLSICRYVISILAGRLLIVDL